MDYTHPMQCNIDAKGKAARMTGGIITTLIGVVFLILTLLGVVGTWGWAASVCTLIGGGFQIFEARAGWCVLRAMGIKTPV